MSVKVDKEVPSLRKTGKEKDGAPNHLERWPMGGGGSVIFSRQRGGRPDWAAEEGGNQMAKREREELAGIKFGNRIDCYFSHRLHRRSREKKK